MTNLRIKEDHPEMTESTQFLPSIDRERSISNLPITETYKIPLLRYFIVCLATAVAALGLSCSFAFNFAVSCKINSTVDPKEEYDRNPRFSPVMYFPKMETNILYASYSLGVFFSLLVIILWEGYSRLSVRWTVFWTTLLSSLLTLAVPPLYDWSPLTTVFLKVLQGACIAPTIPLVGHITSHWTPLAELGVFVSVLTSYSQFGLFFLMASSGVLCEFFAWRGVFLFHGACSLVVAFLWVFLYRDDPCTHPWISVGELKVIRHNRSPLESKKSPVPMKKMFSDGSVWACIVACIGNYNGVSPFIVFATLIMKKALDLTDLQASQFNSASFIIQLVLKLASGRASDAWRARETSKVRVFNSLSLGLCGLLIVITAFIPYEYKYTCAFMMALFQGIIGFNSAGFNKAAVVVARQHAHAILTCFGMIVTLSTVMEPFIVGYVAPNSSWSEWFWLFIAHGLILLVSNLIFCLFIKAEPAEFTKNK